MEEFKKRFKKAIENNFDASARIYDSFELKYHLFENLTVRLVELIGIENVSRVLDVGCGTGISTYALFKCFGNECSYYGIDISKYMLDIAKDNYSNYDIFTFVQGDATDLKDHFMEKFDAIFFTASIFLIPEYAKCLDDSLTLLNDDGRVAISFYSGITDFKGKDLVKTHFPAMNYRYGFFEFEDLLAHTEKKGIKTMVTEFLYPSDEKFLFDFLSIPAQASGLFPKKTHDDQLLLVGNFIKSLFSEAGEAFLKWTFLICEKG